MIKRFLQYIIIAILGTFGLYFLILIILIPRYVKKLEKPRKIELNNPKLLKYYDINHEANPADYGFHNFEEVSFPSSEDKNLILTGWFIHSQEKSDRCLFLVHGRKSNRQACLPILEIIRSYELNRSTNIFMIDLRNSGNSSEYSSDLGYRVSNDLFDGLNFLQSKYDIRTVNMYGFSMGGMATMAMLDFHKEKIENLNLTIDKIILDSPLSNAKEAIKGEKVHSLVMSDLIYRPFFFVINRRWDGYLDKLNFAYLMRDVNHENIIILQSRADLTTEHDILHSEIQYFNIKTHLFEDGHHTRIYKKNRDIYEKIIVDFLSEEQFS